MSPTFPCSKCLKNVNKNHRAVCCDLCDQWIHIKCNYLNLNDYNKLKNDPDPFFCINCTKDVFPFTNLTNNELILLIKKGINIPSDDESNLFTAHSPNMQNHINNLNEFLNKSLMSFSDSTDDDTDENISPLNCNYYDHMEFTDAKFNSSKSFSIFHFNIHSITKHIESLRTLLLSLDSTNFEFDVIAISESKILKFLNPKFLNLLLLRL